MSIRPRLFPFGVDAPAEVRPDIVVTTNVPLIVVRFETSGEASRLELSKSAVAVVNGEVVP